MMEWWLKDGSASFSPPHSPIGSNENKRGLFLLCFLLAGVERLQAEVEPG